MQNKSRLQLADYEAENLSRLQKMFSRKWEFIYMQAEAQVKVTKQLLVSTLIIFFLNDEEIAETFNAFFSNSVNTLGIVENKLLLNPVSVSDVGVEKCIKMYETHPSIVNIRRHVKIDDEFHFHPITAGEMEKKIGD